MPTTSTPPPSRRPVRFSRRNGALALLTIVLTLAGIVPQTAHGSVTDPLEPAGTGGVTAVERALAKLATHKRLLVVAAHPDDEDTSLLALVSRGLGGEAAYLSLSRGEGGQNLIGEELGVGLGLLRSRELLAARKIDGARQFFTRAYDFGYTRSLEETFERWPREVLEEDVARVIRRFRPQVVVSIFPGEPSPTHGQHQAAGVVAHGVFPKVGEAEAFPGLTAQGLPPYRPEALYRATWFDPDSTTLTLPTGSVDPMTGRSIFQTAMASRSRHRSQDMGMLQPLGSSASRVGWVGGAGGLDAQEIFSGIDTRLSALAAGLPEGSRRTLVEAALERVQTTAVATRRDLSATDASASMPAFRIILADLGAAIHQLELIEANGGAAAAEASAVRRLVEEKRTVAREGLAAAAGLAVDALAAVAYLVPGETAAVEVQLWNAGTSREVTVDGVEIVAPPGWTVAESEPEEPSPFLIRRFGPRPSVGVGPVAPGDLAVFGFAVTPAPDAAPTVPYFLEHPLNGDLYDWTETNPALRGEPFDPPLLTARLTVRVGGRTFPLDREVAYRYQDQARGEERRPLRVLPEVEVAVSPDRTLWSTGAGTDRAPLEITLTRRSAAAVSGRVEVAVPAHWPRPAAVPFTIPEDRSETTVAVPVTPPGDLEPDRYTVAVTAVLDRDIKGQPGNGRRFDRGYPQVAYEHVRPTPMPRPATAEISVVDLTLPPLDRVAYVRGASDRVPEMLAQIGVPLTVLDADALRLQDLSVYDAVVVGSRAYETDPALASAHPRLLDYARAGGLLLVQYQQYQFVRGGYPPYPLDISRPHDRVTDETAAVTLLAPEHPVFRRPNRLGPGDWDGWVQERGLYFAGTWDDAYTPLLEMTDPGGEPLRGGLLVAPLGRGTYVYTGLAFFRQLPAGVPGAYRLFANLLGLADEAPSGRTR